ncbi:MAG: hypothetical protein FJY82_12630 [Candidatus Aminicenantes bacterium]|nr:hypothetical protein [Candidatus Aminicenantes bacterium]
MNVVSETITVATRGFSDMKDLTPIVEKKLAETRLRQGPWQQIVFLDFDNRPRKRPIIVQILGE